MPIREEFEKSGLFLFRWRSFLPVIIVPVILVSLKNYGQLEKLLGERAEDIWETFSIVIAHLGFLLRCIIVGTTPRGTSGRNTKSQKAEVLNTTGVYSLVRHPLYLGNFLIFIGILFFCQSIWLIVVGCMAYALYYERIIFGEESFLRQKFQKEFEEWAARTPAIIPSFKNWTPPNQTFSIKSVLRREYTALFGIALCLTIIKFVGNYFEKHKFFLRTEWWIYLISTFIIYLILRSLKKYTKILNV